MTALTSPAYLGLAAALFRALVWPTSAAAAFVSMARSPAATTRNLSPPLLASLWNVDASADGVPPSPLHSPRRRDFLSSATASAAVSIAAAAAALAASIPRPAFATIMDVSSDEVRTFKPGEKIGVDEARRRFVLARRDLQALLDGYDDVARGGGDAVRRYLGTVGVTSYMYGIGKVLNELRGEAEDIVDFTEAMNEFNAYVYQADGAAYSSMFVEHSSAKGTPESYLKTAKADAARAMKYMDELAVQLGL